MTIDPYILSFSALTVIATIWMGFWAARKSKTAHDFFVAGRSVSVGWNASAISGEYLSAASFMGVAGMVMSSGYDALWYPVCYACGYLFLLLFIAGPLRRFGAYTIPDFAEGRYDSPVFRKIAVVFVLFIGFFYTMPQMKGAGTTLAYIFPGLPYWAGVVLVGAVITLNVALGGMKGITLVQAFQYWAKMFAISVPIFVLMSVYGHYGRQVGANAQRPTLNIQLSTNASPAALNVERSTLSVERFPSPDEAARGEPGLNTFDVRADTSTEPTPLSELAKPLQVPSMSLSPSSGPSRTTYTVAVAVTLPLSEFVRLAVAPTSSRTSSVSSRILRGGAPIGNATLFVDTGLKKIRIPSEISRGLLERESEKVYGRLSEPDSIRKPLPEKAPADANWLNPFGPLTSKAAKAAVISPQSDFDLIADKESFASKIQPLRQVRYAPNLYGLIAQIKAIVQKPTSPNWRTSVRTGASNIMVAEVAAPLVLYESAANRMVFWQTNLAQFPRFPMNLSHSATTTDAEFAALIESGLRSNGVVIVAAPHDSVLAVAAKDLAELKTQAISKLASNSQATVRKYALLYTYSLIIALVCGTAGLPHILVRFYTNPDGVAAKRTTMWVMILIGVFYVFPPIFGVMGRNLLPELYTGSGAKGTDKVVLELPRVLERGGNSGDTGVGTEQGGKGEKERGGEISSAPFPPFSPAASNVTKSAKRIPWGSILSGITCAGAFAAFMSTFSGLLVSMTGALAHDVYGRMLRPNSTPQQRMRAFRYCAVVLGAGAILAGMQVEPFQINFMVGQAFAIAAASYFPLLFMSAWWRGMTMTGAATGMLAGGVLALVGITLTSFSDLKWLPLDAFWASHPLARILCEQPAIWAVPLAISLMVIVSKLTAREVPSDVRMKMLVLHAPEQLGLKQEYIQEHQH